jgi:hypothetical protein
MEAPMDDRQFTPTQLACATSHALLLEAIRLREQLLDRLDAVSEALDHADIVRHDLWSRFDQLYRVVTRVDARVNRRRLAWLELQREVFLELGSEARGLRRSSEWAASVERLDDVIVLASLRARR